MLNSQFDKITLLLLPLIFLSASIILILVKTTDLVRFLPMIVLNIISIQHHGSVKSIKINHPDKFNRKTVRTQLIKILPCKALAT